MYVTWNSRQRKHRPFPVAKSIRSPNTFVGRSEGIDMVWFTGWTVILFHCKIYVQYNAGSHWAFIHTLCASSVIGANTGNTTGKVIWYGSKRRMRIVNFRD